MTATVKLTITTVLKNLNPIQALSEWPLHGHHFKAEQTCIGINDSRKKCTSLILGWWLSGLSRAFPIRTFFNESRSSTGGLIKPTAAPKKLLDRKASDPL